MSQRAPQIPVTRNNTHQNIVQLVDRSEEDGDTGSAHSNPAVPGKDKTSRYRELLRHSWPPTISSYTDASSASTEDIEGMTQTVGVASGEICLDDIEWGKVIGEGFFGRVYSARHRRTDQKLVLKELKRDHEHREEFMHEMTILKTLSHPNILEYVGIFCKDRKLFLVTEFISGGTLSDLIADHDKQLPWNRRIRMAHDLATGMAYLHSKRIIHRDLKSENCMVRADSSVVVVDFGLAREMEDETLKVETKVHTLAKRRSTSVLPLNQRRSLCREARPMSVCGSPYWMAPEMMMTGSYGVSADVFSFGIVCCELVGRIPADPDIMPRTITFGIDEEQFRADFAGDCPERFLSLAFQCCSLAPDERPSFGTVESRLRGLAIQREAADSALRAKKMNSRSLGVAPMTPVKEAPTPSKPATPRGRKTTLV